MFSNEDIFFRLGVDIHPQSGGYDLEKKNPLKKQDDKHLFRTMSRRLLFLAFVSSEKVSTILHA